MPSSRWLGLAVLVLVVGLSSSLGFWLVQTWRFRVDLARARDLLSERRYDEARLWLARQVGTDRADGELDYMLGICEHAAGRFQAALTAWERIPPHSAFATRGWLARAQTLAGDLGRFAAAEPLLERARRGSGPEAREALYALTQLCFYQGRDDEMRRLLEAGWDRSQDKANDLRDHWRIDEATVSLDEVRAEVERAARLAPEDDRVWLAQAYLATLTGQDGEARRRLDACLKARPDDPAAWWARLRWARAFGHVEEARTALEHLPADRLRPEDALDIQAWLAARDGRRDDERRALEQRIAREPGFAPALERLAVLAAEAGQTDETNRYRRLKAQADAQGERYMRLLEDSGPLRSVEQFAALAELAEGLGRWFEARGWWSLAVVADRGKASYREGLARVEARLRAPTAPLLAGTRSRGSKDRGGGETEGLPRTDDAGAPPRFQDDADRSGLRFTFENGRSTLRQLPETSSGGLGLIDYDGDGRLDVYVVQGGRFPPDAGASSLNRDRLFRNRGEGHFEDATEAAGLAALPGGYGHGVAVGDYDNDGRPDLLITRWRSYALYHNRGDGTFEDVTEPSGLGGDRGWPTSAAFADLDNDGDLDLYVCHYAKWDASQPILCPRQPGATAHAEDGSIHDYCNPNPIPAEADHLFRNDGGRFVDVSEAAGITAGDTDGRGFGVVAADLDGDGRLDLYVANDTTANFLWHNRGDLTFEEIGLTAGVAAGLSGGYQAGMGTTCGDLDGDGLPDLFVTNFYGESTTYYRNLGGALFTDETAPSGLGAASRFLLGFGIALLDFNNDGRLDLTTANGHVNDIRPKFPYTMPALLMAGSGGGRLIDVTRQAGPAYEAPRIGRGLAAGDLDNDGRVDVLLVSQNEPLAYLHNETAGGHFLTLRLEGTRSNRDGVGAAVTVAAGGRSQTAWRLGGGAFQSASDPRLHFGIGPAERVESITVRWPSGQEDRFENLPADRAYRLREGQTEAAPLP